MENTRNQIIELLTPLLQPLGYEVVQAEVQVGRQRVLRVFIDHTGGTSNQGTIGIEDCVKATRALEEPLDTMPEIEALFKGPYELEISSPGVERPLRTERDFSRFAGRRIRVHTFRPLTEAEIGNPGHLAKNPKQKSFLGTLQGLTADGRVRLAPTQEEPKKGQAKKAAKAGKKGKVDANAGEGAGATNGVEEVLIPLPLISKANLEPVFEFDRDEETVTKNRSRP
jgi:ribosome maturation factor RimP